jgi:hypothetical protein
MERYYGQNRKIIIEGPTLRSCHRTSKLIKNIYFQPDSPKFQKKLTILKKSQLREVSKKLLKAECQKSILPNFGNFLKNTPCQKLRESSLKQKQWLGANVSPKLSERKNGQVQATIKTSTPPKS